MASTPIGRVSFPNLFKPSTFKGKTKFSCTLLFDNEVDLSKVIADIDAAIKKKWPDGIDDLIEAGDFYYPILDGNKKFRKSPKSVEYKGRKFITLKSNPDHPPAIFDQKKNLITDPKVIYPGSLGRASYNIYTWDSGVALGLLGYQFVGDAERFSSSGNPEDDFDIVDVGDEDDVAF